MSEDPPAVVPIKADVTMQQPSSAALLEFVGQALAAFETEEEPDSIAFVIYGKNGTTRVAWMAEAAIGGSSLCAFAGALLLHQAAKG